MSTPPITEKFATGGWCTPSDQAYDLTETFVIGPSLGEVKERLAELSSTLEAKLKDVSDGMENNFEPDEYHFDAGFTAGLRVALNDLAKLSESL